MAQFDRMIRCTLKELYDCNGVDGFDDLIEAKLGHGISDADGGSMAQMANTS